MYTNENIAFIQITNLDALNEKQREAVVSTDKRLLVLAGAGSGKTKTLLQKIIYLIEEKGGESARHTGHHVYQKRRQ